MQTATTTNHHGDKVTAVVGLPIWFKSDIEQSAFVKAIVSGGWNGRVLEVVVDVTEGEYAGPGQRVALAECWN